MKEICCIGHITHDKVVTPKATVHMPGGTAYYFAHAIAALDPDCCSVITSVSNEDLPSAEKLRALGIETIVIPSRESVYFENIYGENTDERRQRVLAKADPFTLEKLNGADACIFHLGTLLADDFNEEVIPYLASSGKISVDAQGYLREVRDSKVYPVDWSSKLKLLPYIDILKVNEHEAEVLSGTSNLKEACKILADWGVKEVVLTLGSKGSVIYSDARYHEIKAFQPTEIIDVTGCGDTYMAAYLYKRAKGETIENAGTFAAAMCTLKLAESGPFRGTVKEINDIISGNEN